MKKYYKVLRITSFGGESPFVTNPELKISYFYNHWSFPLKGTKLFIFDNLYEASVWKNRFHDKAYQIFEIEPYNPRQWKYGSFTTELSPKEAKNRYMTLHC